MQIETIMVPRMQKMAWRLLRSRTHRHHVTLQLRSWAHARRGGNPQVDVQSILPHNRQKVGTARMPID